MKKKQQLLKVNMISSTGNSFFNWIAILIKNKFNIQFKYIPRAILVTFITIILYPFVLFEMLIFNKRIRKTEVKSPVFIIGHMRSGTTFLHYLMCQDKKFAFVSTTETVFPWVFLTLNKVLRAIMNLILPKKRPMDNMDIGENLPQEDEFAIANLCPYSPNNGAYFPKNLEKFYHKYSFFEDVEERIILKWKKTYIYFLKKIAYKSGGKRILSKSLVNSGRIKLLLEMFPDAKFIFIYRNPYKVFLSTKKLYQKFVFKHMSFHDLDDSELETVILKLAKLGFQRYFNERQLVPEGSIIEVQFEDFIKNPLLHLDNIYKTLKIEGFNEVKPYFTAYLKDYENYKQDKYEIDDSLKERIYTELKTVFDRFGYPKQ